MNNSGITLITLIVMIIIILILSSIFVVTGMNSLDESKEAQIEREIHSLKQAINVRYTEYEKNDGSVLLFGTLAKKTMNEAECIAKIEKTLSDEEKTKDLEKISGDLTENFDEYVMIIKKSDKKNLGLENYSADTNYIVDYRSGRVFGPIDL